MAMLSETDLGKLSTSAAEDFVDSYYTCLNSHRQHLASYYVSSSMLANTRALPHISYNGTLVTSASQLQETFEKQMPWTHFEVQSLNVHVLNPTVAGPLGDKATKREQEGNISLMVQVSGYVRLFERKEGPMRGFSDNFVLVPNKEEAAAATGRAGKGKDSFGRRWTIQTQNFRFVA